MAGNIDAVKPGTEAQTLLQQQGDHSSAAHLHNDCNLADSRNSACSDQQKPGEKAANTLDFSTPVPGAAATDAQTAMAATGKPTDGAGRPTDGVTNPPGLPKTEDEFMKIAPDIYRSALGLPQDASSKTLVDNVIGKQVKALEHAFEHASNNAQKGVLDLMNVDKKTEDKILAHNKDSEKALAGALLKQERTFLDIPPTLTGESAYKAIEKGIQHNDYQAMVDVRKLQIEMSKP